MKKTTMAGTDGTHEYDETAVETTLGSIGFRNLGSTARVRIEPKDSAAAATLAPTFPRSAGWKQPGDSGQNRFSNVVYQAHLEGTLKTALLAVAAGDTELSDDTPAWARAIVTAASQSTTAQPATTVDKASLVAKARSLGVKGANPHWSVETLTAKIAAATPAQPEPPAETPEDEKARLVAKARELGLPGANLAPRWNLATLRAKLGV